MALLSYCWGKLEIFLIVIGHRHTCNIAIGIALISASSPCRYAKFRCLHKPHCINPPVCYLMKGIKDCYFGSKILIHTQFHFPENVYIWKAHKCLSFPTHFSSSACECWSVSNYAVANFLPRSYPVTQLVITMEPRFNEPLFNEVLGITNDILQLSNSKCMEKYPDITNPRYNEPNSPVP